MILTKFRLSNHKLMIEVGRYTKIPKEMRFCHFCPNMVETEAHFLFYCIVYKPIRATMYDSVNILNNNFKHFPDDLKMRYLLSDMNASIANYIVSSQSIKEQSK